MFQNQVPLFLLKRVSRRCCALQLLPGLKAAGPLTHIVGNLALAQVAGLRSEMNRLAWRLPGHDQLDGLHDRIIKVTVLNSVHAV